MLEELYVKYCLLLVMLCYVIVNENAEKNVISW